MYGVAINNRLDIIIIEPRNWQGCCLGRDAHLV